MAVWKNFSTLLPFLSIFLSSSLPHCLHRHIASVCTPLLVLCVCVCLIDSYTKRHEFSNLNKDHAFTFVLHDKFFCAYSFVQFRKIFSFFPQFSWIEIVSSEASRETWTEMHLSSLESFTSCFHSFSDFPLLFSSSAIIQSRSIAHLIVKLSQEYSSNF